MPRVKIAVIGAGSFVFGPGVLKGVILEQKLPGVELALMDVNRQAVELMAGVGRRMAREAGLDTKITAHTDRGEAIDGANFVFNSAAPEMARRFQMDWDIIARRSPGHLVTEFGGLAGIGYSLRQIAFIRDVAQDMLDRCPRGWLFNTANPLPRVCQAADEAGVNTVGFCSVSISAHNMLWRIFFGHALEYPYAEGPAKWDLTLAGLNHFSWVLGLRDRATGEDLMPALRRRLDEGHLPGEPLAEGIYRTSGWLLGVHDNHTQDFLPPHPTAEPRVQPWHGSPAERAAKLQLMIDIVEGREPAEKLLTHTSWEKPVDLVAAMAYGRHIDFHALNLHNHGQMAALPEGVFVETPCAPSAHGPVPEHINLPAPVQPYCLRTAEVTDTIVRAATERKRVLAHRAVELDPTVVDKAAGIAAMDEILAAHEDVIGKFE